MTAGNVECKQTDKPVNLPAWIQADLPAHIQAYGPTHSRACMLQGTHSGVPASRPARGQVCMHAYMQTYIHAKFKELEPE